MEGSVADKESWVIGSDYEDVELQNTNIWNFHLPFFEKFANLKAFVNVKTEEFNTFGDIKEASLRFAKELKKYFQDGEFATMAIILPNCIEYPMVVHASNAIGIPICSLRDDYKAEMLLSMMKDVNSKVLVTDAPLLDKLKIIFEEMPNLKVFVRGSSTRDSIGTNLHSVLFSGDLLDIEEAKKVDPDTNAIVTYSSGTTGKPKAIMLSQKNIVNANISCMSDAFAFFRDVENGEQERVVGNLPFAHIYCGLTYFYCALMKGTCTYVTEFADAEQLVQIIDKYKITAVTIRPYMVDAVAKLENIAERLKSARIFISAGSPPNPDAVKRLKKAVHHKICYQDCYGTSETLVGIITPVNAEREGSTGKLVPNVKTRIVDINSGKCLSKPFQEGELLIKVPWLMKGYFNNPEATKEAIDNGWYKSGDIAYFDEDHYFYVVERFKDLINFRGKKISPNSIESIIKKHNSVVDVGVIGVSGEISDGEVPRAFVCVKDPVNEQELIDFVKANAPEEGMWLRGGVQFLNSIPRTHLGKVQRKYLRDMGWTGSSSFKS